MHWTVLLRIAIITCLPGALPCWAAVVGESFATDPALRGWRTFGDASLFLWNATNQNLEVTWDSSRTNSFFYLPLGNILAKADDFGLSFDLVLHDYVIGTTSSQPYTFPVAIGFLNLDEATQPNFSRGSGASSRYGPKNLLEFDFFPAFDVFAPTVAQVLVSTNNVWLFNHDNFLEITPGASFRITMNFVAGTRRLTTTTLRNGVQYGQTQVIEVPTNIFDFRTTAVSVSSYSDQHADGSILAHGSIDNVTIVTPPAPIQNLRGYWKDDRWHVAFFSRSDWLYTLQVASDLRLWTDASSPTNGNGAELTLTGKEIPSAEAFYRIRATRP